jgi:hypothetical protein
MGWDGKGRKGGNWKPATDEQPAFSERNRDRIEFAQKNLPGEHEGFVVIAMQMLQSAGEEVTRNSILARLKATGRDRDSVNAQAKRYGQKEPLT